MQTRLPFRSIVSRLRVAARVGRGWATVLLATAIPMALLQRAGWHVGITLFGLVAAGTFLVPGIKFHRQRRARGA